MSYVIGVDFDNTIVSYDTLMHSLAVEKGLIHPNIKKIKKHIRDAIRQLRNDIEWQKIQGLAYGPRIEEAELIDGVKDFFKLCRIHNIKVYIISHKTEYARYDDTRTNLRDAAMKWMAKNHFFDELANNGLGFSKEDIYFESTREAKINRIKQLRCTHFIDDLEETYLEPSFPDNVIKILYAPYNEQARLSGVKIFSRWKDISEYMFGESCGTDDIDLKKIFSKLLGRRVIFIERIGGGRNTKVYVLSTEKKKYVAKQYFYHDSDARDRLSVEFSSLKFLWENGVRCIPKPILANRNHNTVIYEYIEGNKISADEVTEKDIDYATNFLIRLEKLKAKKESNDIPVASEACFSFQEVITHIQVRLKKLFDTSSNTPIYEELHDFLENELLPCFKIVMRWAKAKIIEAGYLPSYVLRRDERTLSPSDFGFHNALRKNNKEIIFLDFEYFGWDDPAKMMADFLLHPHPAMNLSTVLKKRFVSNLLKHFVNFKNLAKRLEAVYPLFGIKWCIIILNEFIPEYLLRRKFASKNQLEISRLQAEQLEKAKRMLKRIMKEYKNFPYAPGSAYS
ncbi:MAG: phosphotransferase [Deltaproteobacteria bacterium]|nr:phosphotransferase [Deltaproteobacteria bacterium]